MTMPTAEEAICLYLYGQKTPPADLKSEQLIREPGNGSVPLDVDINEYMTTGGGRFVKVENFNYVRNFLAGSDYTASLKPGVYTRDQLLEAYGLQKEDGSGGQLDRIQYYFGINDQDYMDRAYVFGSAKFKINSDAEFIINPDGSREILNIAVVPVNDNFDYESTTLPAQITNWLTKNRIDPSGIGRTVAIEFRGAIANKQCYTGEDWYAMDIANKLDSMKYYAGMTDLIASPFAFERLYLRILQSGIVDYKDSEGHFVYYDGKSPTNSGTLVGAEGVGNVQLRGAIYDGSVALIGGGGNDQLTGSVLADELYGNDGDDTLNGGDGNDILQGGGGDNDTYQFEGDFGTDTIDDADLAGAVTIDGKAASGGKCIAPDRWYDESNKITYTRIGDDLVIQSDKNSILIKDFKEGQFGIQLPGLEAKPNVALQTERTIKGDYKPLDTNIMEDGVQIAYDELGNIVQDTKQPDPNYADTLYDSSGHDKIIAGGGNDTISAFRGGNDNIDAGTGNDDVDAGEGNDQIQATAGEDRFNGGAGNDSIEGGTESDMLFGQADDDQLFADTKLATDDPYENNEQQQSSTEAGDWLDGGAGQDLLVGSAGSDMLVGGVGRDTLLGGGGDDNLLGDANSMVSRGWGWERVVETYSSDSPTYIFRLKTTNSGYTDDPMAGEDDVLYGGTGNDWVYGGGGNDLINTGADDDVAFAGSGDDLLILGEGNDVADADLLDLPGTAYGNDVIYAGGGNDIVKGGGGDDVIYGGIGNDELTGDYDSDRLPGEIQGNDYLDGGAGDDILYGRGGAICFGGATGMTYCVEI